MKYIRMKYIRPWSILLALAGAGELHAQQSGSIPVRSVSTLDLVRYAGRWYEVARFPNRFQAKCARETTADYTLLADGAIQVVNTCVRADGSEIRAKGRAKLAHKGGSTSQLKVRFAPAFLSALPMVWGNYWVLDLTDDYSAALVGDPGRDYLWILARTPQLTDSTYQRMISAAAAQGFNVSRVTRTTQAGDPH